jgi:hypothetical protein
MPVEEEKLWLGRLGSEFALASEVVLRSTTLESFVSATILAASSAIHVKNFDDPYVVDAEKAMHIFNVTTVPGAFLVDVLPFCESCSLVILARVCLINSKCIVRYVPSWFPGAAFQKQAKLWREDMDRARSRPVDSVMKDVVSTKPPFVILPPHMILLIPLNTVCHHSHLPTFPRTLVL